MFKPTKTQPCSPDEMKRKMEPSNFGEKFSTIISHGFIAMEIGIGHKLGLFDALNKFTSPVTSQELASECKLKERYVREWLGSMTAAEVVFMEGGDKYFIPEDCKPHLETSYLASALPVIAHNYKECLECFQQDGPSGYDYSNSLDCLIWLGEGKAMCTPEWLDDNLFPLKYKGKDTVGNVLDFGCGTGELTLKIGEYLPKARVIGVDLDDKAIKRALDNKDKSGVENVDFLLLDGNGLDESWTSRFDWIIMVDVMHDLPNPGSIMADMKRVLKQDGVISAIDPEVHSEHKKNVGNLQYAVLYVFSTLVCLPNSLSQKPGVGNGIGWGVENKVKFLKSLDLDILNEDSDSLTLVHCKKSKK